jgi:hypothetical protein
MTNINRLKRVFLKWTGNKLLLLILSGVFLFQSEIFSQCKFTIGHGDDVYTVCINDSIHILNYSGGPCGDSTLGDKHEWNYQSASLSNPPAIDTLKVKRWVDNAYISMVQDSGKYYAFVTRSSPPMISRYDFDSLLSKNNPKDTSPCGLMPFSNLINGISVQFDTLTDKWYGFITSGTSNAVDDTSPDKAKIFRITFGNGIHSNATKIEDLGSYGSMFRKPTKIVLVNEKGHWYGFVANSTWLPIITKLDFTNGLGGDSASIKVDNYVLDKTLIGSSTKGITGLSVVKSKSSWHIFCVNVDVNYLIRADFDSNFIVFSGTKVIDPDHNINKPMDINVSNDCNSFVGIVTNTNTNDQTFSMVHFNESITGTIRTNKSPKNLQLMNNLYGLSEVVRTQGNIYTFILNQNGPITRIRFKADDSSHTVPALPKSNGFKPADFAFDTTGIFTVTLTVNGDYSKTTCRTVYVMNRPVKPIIDTTADYCIGDSIQIYNYQDFKGKPDYNWTFPDSSVHVLKFPIIEDTGYYKLFISYDLCKSKEARGLITQIGRAHV